MAYDPDLLERLRAVAARAELTEKPMFGGVGFLVDGTMAFGADSRGTLMVRVGAAGVDALVSQEGVQPFEMRGRTMRGWVRVDLSVVADDVALGSWTARGLAAARAAPPKRRP